MFESLISGSLDGINNNQIKAGNYIRDILRRAYENELNTYLSIS